MKLSRLYCNEPTKFGPIDFSVGLNVIFGEIRLPETRSADTHNLGKSILSRLLDFCLLAKKSREIFLFKRIELFTDFVFFLEVELLDGGFLTIRRSVEAASKASFMLHEAGGKNFVRSEDSDWTHPQVGFKKAKDILDSILDLSALKPWTFRKALGYHVRSQKDYIDEFKLDRYRGGHGEWKPSLAHLLGLNSELVESSYQKESQLKRLTASIKEKEEDLPQNVNDLGKLEGTLLIKEREVEDRSRDLYSFDFSAQEEKLTSELVGEVEVEISELNSSRYWLGRRRARIEQALRSENTLFSVKEAEVLFGEAEALFPIALKRSFEDLLSFRKSIVVERRKGLREELKEVEEEIGIVGERLKELGLRRREALDLVRGEDVFQKYRLVSERLIDIKAEVLVLQRARKVLLDLEVLKDEKEQATSDLKLLHKEIGLDLKEKSVDRSSHLSKMRLYFSEIVEEVLDQSALLNVQLNKQGHLEFSVEMLGQGGMNTSAGDGHSYKKILCVAFDLALLRAFQGDLYIRFVYHDGIFESLDDRRKRKLVEVLRRHANLGLQLVVTMIDSDLPSTEAGPEDFLRDDEIVLWLHDEGDKGRLFRMPAW